MTITDILSQIKTRADAATLGLWKTDTMADNEHPVVYIDHPKIADAATVLFEADWATEEDATFIAAARQDLPALVKALERALRTLETTHDSAIYEECSQCKALADIEAILTQPETKP